MYSSVTTSGVYSVLGAALITCILFAGNVSAEGRPVTVALNVSTRGLDIETTAGARELYSRLKNAAWIACTRANRTGLAPSLVPNACSDNALGEAIRSAQVPLLVQAYLEKHSMGQAAAHGIYVPAQVAAKSER